MPTLTYELRLMCQNCWHQQTVKVPRGKRFIPAIPSVDSAYERDGRIVTKHCDYCGCAMLTFDPTYLPELLVEVMSAAGGHHHAD